jgi:hypothetical protein
MRTRGARGSAGYFGDCYQGAALAAGSRVDQESEDGAGVFHVD